MKEIWKETNISGYFISNLGHVRGRSGKIMKPYLNKTTGYYTFSIHPEGRKGKAILFRIHRLVAEAFIPNPNNFPEVNHIDGNKLNNHVTNLEWCTAKYNTLHAFKNGLAKAKRGWYHDKSKLTEKDVKYIKSNFIKGDINFGCRALAKKFNIAHTTISRIIRNLNYFDCDHNSKVE